MRSDWRVMPFIEAVVVNPRIKLERGKAYPFISMAAVDPNSQWVDADQQREYKSGGSRFQHGDTLMARITPCLENGKIARYRSTDESNVAFGSTEFIVIRGRQEVTDNRYAYYLTQSAAVRDYAISQMTGTSGRQRVPTSALNHIDVPLPPLPEQRHIAHILGTLDDKIELNRRMNATLEGMARALFKSWFVDFEPVRSKMEGRWRRGESLAGMPAELWDAFPERLVASELGKVPEGWEPKVLGDTIEIYDSVRVPLNRRQRSERQGCYPYYGAAGIMDYVDDFLFDGTYVLIGEDGSVANADGHPVTQYVWGKFWVNNHAHILKGKNDISEEHLYLLLQQVNVDPFVTGAVQPKLSQRNLKSIPAILPDTISCQAFASLIKPMFAEIRTASEESHTLAELRDALLPGLVSAEVGV